MRGLMMSQSVASEEPKLCEWSILDCVYPTIHQLYQIQCQDFQFYIFISNFKEMKEKLKLVLILKSLFPHFGKMFVCFVLVLKYSCDQMGKGIIPMRHTSYIKSLCVFGLVFFFSYTHLKGDSKTLQKSKRLHFWE